MKINRSRKALSFILAGALVLGLASAAGVPAKAYAAEEDGAGKGKYVSDVFIAYGKDEKKAASWLTDNGWEPVEGDFNAGKASFFDNNKLQDQNVAAVMGIKRTDDKDDAITDMAVMNMKGGYSIADYESLIKDKKAQIDEMINGFMPVINEFRANRDSQGSEFGKKRADLAYDLLNRFYDGNPEDAVAVNDTGMKLGDFFVTATRQEDNENGGDLQQLMLESSGPAMLAVETLLVMAADNGRESWLERASGLTGDELSENLPIYVPEASGRDITESEAVAYLNGKYGDTAVILANQWSDVHEEMLWFEAYNEEHDLWQQDGESEEDYLARRDQYFNDLKESDEETYNEVHDRYITAAIIYNGIYEIPYAGDWGETLGDFFNPAGDDAFSGDSANFLPLAAGLSEGQRVGLDYLSLEMMLIIGLGNEKGLDEIASDIAEIFEDREEVDIYTGVNRAAFRGGVALTSEALMDQNAGRGQAYDKLWDNIGIMAITSYAAAFVGVVAMGVGAYMVKTGVRCLTSTDELVRLNTEFRDADQVLFNYKINNFGAAVPEDIQNAANTARQNLENALNDTETTEVGVAGRWVLGVGGAILIGAAIVKGIQLYKYYDRTMTPIPRMIVDESDVVTYLTDENGKPLLDENGKQKKTIDFKTYEYYTAVGCNRPDVGEIGEWQDGVKDYKNEDHYCYDIADLNADMGQEWIALYTVKSPDKGDPVLADTLTVQYGKNKMPEGCSVGLHLFEYTNAVDLGDTAWAFNNDKNGVRLYWGVDKEAFAAETASGFTSGSMALAAVGGLIIGIGGATVLSLRRRKKDEEPAQNETTA